MICSKWTQRAETPVWSLNIRVLGTEHFLVLSMPLSHLLHMSLHLPDDMFTSAKGTAVSHSQCFTMLFSILYLICNPMLRPDLWHMDFSTSFYTLKSGTDLCEAQSHCDTSLSFEFWRMGVVDRSVLKSRRSHWDALYLCYPRVLT